MFSFDKEFLTDVTVAFSVLLSNTILLLWEWSFSLSKYSLVFVNPYLATMKTLSL